MDKLEPYRTVVKKVLTEYHTLNIKAQNSTLESVLIFDESHDNYLLILMGWQRQERIKSMMIHIRLLSQKIWIEEDWTEEGVATDLLREGILPTEIVLAFHPPDLRQHTEFSVA